MRLSIEQIPLLILFLLPLFASFTKQRLLTILVIWAACILTYYYLRVKYRLFNTSKKWKITSIGSSHFCEKIRWCLQYSGIDFEEEFDAGIVGVFLFQRTVPVLTIPRKRVSIGNSPDILRYAYGNICGDAGYSDKIRKFLQPSPEALELEKKFDEVGTAYQIIIYHEMFENKQRTLQTWLGLMPDGNYSKKIPMYQCITCLMLYPAIVFFMKKALNITSVNVEKTIHYNKRSYKNGRR